MGGISYPLLADFHPKGAVAESFGLYLADKGITDRATVIIDAGGTIQHISSVGPGGERDITALVELCEQIDKAYEGTVEGGPKAAGLEPGGTLYVRNNCGASRDTLLAVENLHIQSKVTVKNVSENSSAMAELKEKTGAEQAPVYILGDNIISESADIVKTFVSKTTGF